MAVRGAQAVRRVALEAVGWVLVVVGVAALILPGPGLLMVFAGMAILSQQYAWAARRLEPVKQKALQTAQQSVETKPRIVISVLSGILVIGIGVVWGLRPPAPGWWPVDDSWWLFGGWGPGSTLIVSGLIAVALVAYSYRRFRQV
jgi:uncharacterized protein (TIGR02611 family)